mmetsp:Transcript_16212/g.46301  ORF Transcript_16212/g.46301 Transcript_16212/m.46301 type:complete len:213 (+) Transcript_16212:424-1062(+)
MAPETVSRLGERLPPKHCRNGPGLMDAGLRGGVWPPSHCRGVTADPLEPISAEALPVLQDGHTSNMQFSQHSRRAPFAKGAWHKSQRPEYGAMRRCNVCPVVQRACTCSRPRPRACGGLLARETAGDGAWTAGGTTNLTGDPHRSPVELWTRGSRKALGCCHATRRPGGSAPAAGEAGPGLAGPLPAAGVGADAAGASSSECSQALTVEDIK